MGILSSAKYVSRVTYAYQIFLASWMKYESSCTFGMKRWEYRKGEKKSYGDAAELDIERQRIRTTAKSIRVPDCYSLVLIRHVSWTWWFWGGGYSAKREVSIGRFELVCWFSFEIEQARVRVQCILFYTFDMRVRKRKDETMVASV